MEHQLWKAIVALLATLGKPRKRRDKDYTDHDIVQIYYWAVIHDRSQAWACQQKHWPIHLRRRSLPELQHGTTMTSTMMDVNVDRSDPLPLHNQVAAQIRRAIADGEAGPGERLPLAKDLAALLGVNKNTVLRALHLLREEGLLEFRRGRGITVVGTPQRGAVLARARELVEFARRHGFGRDEVIQMIETLP